MSVQNDITQVRGHIYDKFRKKIEKNVRLSMQTDPRFWRRLKRNEEDVEKYTQMICNKFYAAFDGLPIIVHYKRFYKKYPEDEGVILAFIKTYPVILKTILEFPHLKISVQDIIGEPLYQEIYEDCKKIVARLIF